jgi:hypothetical protein
VTSHRKITFDELAKAQDILKNGFESGTITRYEIAVLAKYYFSIGVTGTKLKKELIEFCKVHSSNFNEITHRETINDALKIAEKYNLKTCDDVIITKAEMDIIRLLPYKYAKFLFAMIALSKNLKQNKTAKKQKHEDNGKYYCNHSLREIARVMKTSMTNDDIKIMKHYLDAECGYISATEISTNLWEICIINNESESEIIIEDMNNLLQYLPIFCEKCRKSMQKNELKKKHGLCENCYNEQRKEVSKKIMADKREK